MWSKRVILPGTEYKVSVLAHTNLREERSCGRWPQTRPPNMWFILAVFNCAGDLYGGSHSGRVGVPPAVFGFMNAYERLRVHRTCDSRRLTRLEQTIPGGLVSCCRHKAHSQEITVLGPVSTRAGEWRTSHWQVLGGRAVQGNISAGGNHWHIVERLHLGECRPLHRPTNIRIMAFRHNEVLRAWVSAGWAPPRPSVCDAVQAFC